MNNRQDWSENVVSATPVLEQKLVLSLSKVSFHIFMVGVSWSLQVGDQSCTNFINKKYILVDIDGHIYIVNKNLLPMTTQGKFYLKNKRFSLTTKRHWDISTHFKSSLMK